MKRMKRLYISIFIIAILISTGIISLWHLTKVTEEANSMIDQAIEAVENDDIFKAEQLNEQLLSFWDENRSYIVLYVRNDDIDTIGSLLSELNPLLKYGNISEYMSKLSNIKHMFEKMAEEEFPYPSNIL